MGTESAASGRDQQSPTGADVPLERYADVTTEEGDLLVYDLDVEDAWIQADRYRSLEECR